jgi:hypothetical protein
MSPAWMNAFGDGQPLKPQPANAGTHTATNAADKVEPTTPRQYMDHSVDFRYAGLSP